MSDEQWFRFHPSKFMAGIRGLNANEVKVYICLLCRMYERGGPIRDDAEILATYCEMRPSSFAKARDRLVRLEKLIVTADGRLSNAAAEQEISKRASKLEIAKRAGEKSAEKRQQKQGHNATDDKQSLNYKRREEKRREEKKEEYPPPLSDTRASDTAAEDHLLGRILEAVGIDSGGAVPAYWRPDRAAPYLAAWKKLGLADDEIVATARATRSEHPEPPNGPKALAGAMKAAAQPKADAKTIAARTALWIIEGKRQLVATIPPSRARSLITAGLVTEDQCRAAGVQF